MVRCSDIKRLRWPCGSYYGMLWHDYHVFLTLLFFSLFNCVWGYCVLTEEHDSFSCVGGMHLHFIHTLTSVGGGPEMGTASLTLWLVLETFSWQCVSCLSYRFQRWRDGAVRRVIGAQVELCVCVCVGCKKEKVFGCEGLCVYMATVCTCVHKGVRVHLCAFLIMCIISWLGRICFAAQSIFWRI